METPVLSRKDLRVVPRHYLGPETTGQVQTNEQRSNFGTAVTLAQPQQRSSLDFLPPKRDGALKSEFNISKNKMCNVLHISVYRPRFNSATLAKLQHRISQSKL